ncbi:MAG: hypothetical protein RRY34_07980, partial [Victivallaceae bacterium]
MGADLVGERLFSTAPIMHSNRTLQYANNTKNLFDGLRSTILDKDIINRIELNADGVSYEIPAAPTGAETTSLSHQFVDRKIDMLRSADSLNIKIYNLLADGGWNLTAESTYSLQKNASGALTALNCVESSYNGAVSKVQNYSYSADSALLGNDFNGYDVMTQQLENRREITANRFYSLNGVEYYEELEQTQEISGNTTQVLNSNKKIYRKYAWGYSLVRQEQNLANGGVGLIEYTYDSGVNFERLLTVKNADGSSESYTYTSDGRLATSTTVRGNLNSVTTNTYTAGGVGEMVVESTTRVNNIITGRRVYNEFWGRMASAANAPATYSSYVKEYDENNVEYITTTYYEKQTDRTGDLVYRQVKVTRPDNTESRTSYSVAGGAETVIRESGYFSGDTLQTGSRSVSVTDNQGRNISSTTYQVENGTALKTGETVNSNFDLLGRAQTTTYMDGSSVSRVYGCCGVESETDRDGVVTTYTYD